MDREKEVNYLQSLFFNTDTELYGDHLYIGDRAIVGATGKTFISDYMKYKTLINSFMNFNIKIKYSFQRAIDLNYYPKNPTKFSIVTPGNEEEFLCYYYIENAIFRTSTLWDLLAQFYNIFCNINLPQDKIQYFSFFKMNFKDADLHVKIVVTEINDYFNESDNSEINGQWKGNHAYVKKYRNKMTHRNTPDEVSISNFDFNLKEPPSFLLKRSIEDYNQGCLFLEKIIRMALDKTLSNPDI